MTDKKEIFGFIDFETCNLPFTKDGISPTKGGKYTPLMIGDAKPIEIGIVFTDDELNVLTQYEALIGWNGLFERDDNGELTWKREFLRAGGVHKIEPEFYIKNALPRKQVVEEIETLCGHFTEPSDVFDKVIMYSDNPFFEFLFINIMWGSTREHPFHFNSRGSRDITRLMKVKDTWHIHRAMDDTMKSFMDYKTAIKKMSESS